MHVVSAKAKHDVQTDDGQSDPYVELSFAGGTKSNLSKTCF